MLFFQLKFQGIVLRDGGLPFTIGDRDCRFKRTYFFQMLFPFSFKICQSPAEIIVFRTKLSVALLKLLNFLIFFTRH